MSDFTIIIEETPKTIVEVAVQGPMGPTGGTLDETVYSNGVISGSTFELDVTNGRVQSVTLSSNVTSFSVIGWGSSGVMKKVTLIITSTGNYTLDLTGWLSAGGVLPTITPSGMDVLTLWSIDGGLTKIVSVDSQDNK